MIVPSRVSITAEPEIFISPSMDQVHSFRNLQGFSDQFMSGGIPLPSMKTNSILIIAFLRFRVYRIKD
jgi:hypothetical protein